MRCGFRMREPPKKRRFDCLALVWRKLRHCRAQRLSLLAQLENVMRISRPLRIWLHIVRPAPLSILKAEAVDRPGSRLIHDPAKHGAVCGVVARCVPPYLMEDVDGELL